MSKSWRVLVSLAAVLVLVHASEGADYGLPLSGAAAEAFLREAEVVARKPIGVGITRPEKVTLSDGVRTHDAVWKTIDEIRFGLKQGRNGGFQLGERDSYRYEIAAYELDKLLDLGLVPPTVERQIDGKTGSLQLWVEGGFTELDRRGQRREPPDIIKWSDQHAALRVFQQLVYDSDHLNIRNILYDASFRVYSIDHSRAFRSYGELLEERRLIRFSRSLLTRLESLGREQLEAPLAEWLSEREIDGILKRRDLIVARAATLAARLGAGNVLFE